MNGRVFSSPVAGFSMTHIKGSKCAMISRALSTSVALQEPPRARRQRAAVFRADGAGPIFKEQDHRHCDDENSRVHRTGFFSPRDKKPNFAMKLALGLDVQTNAKGGKFMSIEDFQDDGAKRVGVCFASNTDLELWTEEVEQGVIDNMIVFQKPFLGAARTELESQLQRAVKVST